VTTKGGQQARGPDGLRRRPRVGHPPPG
jgi:hypothetical protein